MQGTYIGVGTTEEGGFVELAHVLSNRDHVLELVQRILVVLMGSCSTIIVGGEVWTNPCYCTEQKNRVEVHVLQPLGICGYAVDETLQIWTLQQTVSLGVSGSLWRTNPFAGRLVEVIMADMCRDTCMHTYFTCEYKRRNGQCPTHPR